MKLTFEKEYDRKLPCIEVKAECKNKVLVITTQAVAGAGKVEWTQEEQVAEIRKREGWCQCIELRMLTMMNQENQSVETWIHVWIAQKKKKMKEINWHGM